MMPICEHCGQPITDAAFGEVYADKILMWHPECWEKRAEEDSDER
jgi:hypothetical protein